MLAEETRAAEAATIADVVEIWPENWDVWRVFNASTTQWRVMPHGGRMGLDYPAVEWVARRLDVEIDGDCLDRLQVLEATALEVWAEQRERALEKAQRERTR